MMASMKQDDASRPVRVIHDSLSDAPPLRQLEKAMILGVVALAVIVSATVSIALGVDDGYRAAFEVLLTAIFAGFVVSPPITIAAFAAAMAAFLRVRLRELRFRRAASAASVWRNAPRC